MSKPGTLHMDHLLPLIHVNEKENVQYYEEQRDKTMTALHRHRKALPKLWNGIEPLPEEKIDKRSRSRILTDQERAHIKWLLKTSAIKHVVEVTGVKYNIVYNLCTFACGKNIEAAEMPNFVRKECCQCSW